MQTNWDDLKRDADKLGVDWGWLWLYRNGFEHRVPSEIREKIEAKKSIKKEVMNEI